MTDAFPDETLRAYLEDALGEAETARIENELRNSPDLRARLRTLLADGERREHSLGAVWRRRRLSCPTRERLGSFVLDVLDEGWADYVTFHLETIGCPYCQANLADLRAKDHDAAPRVAKRRRIFDSSAGLLKRKDGK